jgi:hypothetical protein
MGVSVRDEEDEEQRDVLHVFSLAVGLQHRANEKHGRAGRTDQVRNHRPNRQEGCIDDGLALEVPLQEYASRDDEQGPEQRDEGDIFLDGVGQTVHCVVCVVVGGDEVAEVSEDGRRPEGRDQKLVSVLFPPMMRNHWKNRDAKKHPSEGNDPHG